MNEKLKNLRSKMNETVLQKGEVSRGDKERIYQAVIHSKKPKRKGTRFVPALSIASCFILLIIFTSYGYSNNILKKQIGDKERSEEVTRMSETKDTEASKLPTTNDRDSIPPEEHFINYIHGMTHQKVQADEKWGLYEMTDKRIVEMLEILERIKGQGTYEHYDFYYETLTEWKKGNFENTVDVHNQIWRWDGGTKGKATRLLTEEEEQEFIEMHYK